MSNDFIEKLKNETSVLHRIAERTGFNEHIFKGTATPEEYCKYLKSKQQIYAELELAVRNNKSNRFISKMYFPEIERNENILTDLDNIPHEETDPEEMLSTVESYIYHLKSISESRPELLLAHTYTLYLADMSGGMIIRDMLMSKYDYKENQLNTYKFDGIADIKTFIADYHDLIGNFVKEAGLETGFIAESKLSYIFSTLILIELVS